MNASVAVFRRCPVCNDSRVASILQSHGVAFLRCAGCTHRFADLAPVNTPDAAASHLAGVYGDEYFEGGGAGYPDYLAEAKLIRRHGLRYANLLERLIGQAAPRGVGSQTQRDGGLELRLRAGGVRASEEVPVGRA